MSIPIIFCIHDSNDQYWPYLAVALQSVLLNSSERLNVCVLHNETLRQEAKEALKKMASKYGATLKFFSIILPTFLAKANFGHFSTASIYRLCIPGLFKDEDAVVYLDSDLVFNGVDIIELITTAPKAPICAVLDTYISVQRKQQDHLALINIDAASYFNSGVLLMRPKQIEQNLVIKFIEFLKKNPVLRHPDQDFLNFEFKDNWGRLNPKFNHQACALGHSLFKPIESYHGKVIHYVGKLKPLQGCMAPGYLPFWMYATGIEKVAKVFDAAPISVLEPDTKRPDTVIARKIRS